MRFNFPYSNYNNHLDLSFTNKVIIITEVFSSRCFYTGFSFSLIHRYFHLTLCKNTFPGIAKFRKHPPVIEVFSVQSFKLFLQLNIWPAIRKSLFIFRINISFGDKKSIVLGGDAGGTKVNLAIFEATASGVKMIKSSSYQSGSFPSVNKILQQFLQENPDYKPEKICLGVAGPVFEGRVAVTNLPWYLDANEIAAATGYSAGHFIK